MNLRAFSLADLPEVNGWLKEHGMLPLEPKDVPAAGYIVPGVAAGFLLQAEARVCFLEGFVSNPSVPSVPRNEALDEIVRSLVTLAGRLEFEKVLFITKEPGLLRRGKLHGFVHANDYAAGILELKKG